MFLVAGPGAWRRLVAPRGGVAASPGLGRLHAVRTPGKTWGFWDGSSGLVVGEVCIILHVRNVRGECLGALNSATFPVWTYVSVHAVTVSSLFCIHSYTLRKFYCCMCTVMHRRYTACTQWKRAQEQNGHAQEHSRHAPPCITRFATRPFHSALQRIAAQQSRLLPS